MTIVECKKMQKVTIGGGGGEEEEEEEEKLKETIHRLLTHPLQYLDLRNMPPKNIYIPTMFTKCKTQY